MPVVDISGVYPTTQSVEIGIDTMSIPHTKRSSGFPIDSVHVPDMYNLVWDGVGMKISATKFEISQNPENKLIFLSTISEACCE